MLSGRFPRRRVVLALAALVAAACARLSAQAAAQTQRAPLPLQAPAALTQAPVAPSPLSSALLARSALQAQRVPLPLQTQATLTQAPAAQPPQPSAELAQAASQTQRAPLAQQAQASLTQSSAVQLPLSSASLAQSPSQPPAAVPAASRMGGRRPATNYSGRKLSPPSGAFALIGVKVADAGEGLVEVALFFNDVLDARSVHARALLVNGRPVPPSVRFRYNKTRRCVLFLLKKPAAPATDSGASDVDSANSDSGAPSALSANATANAGNGSNADNADSAHESNTADSAREANTASSVADGAAAGGASGTFSLTVLHAQSYDGRSIQNVRLDGLSAGTFFKYSREEQAWQKSSL